MLNLCEMIGASFMLVMGLMSFLWVVYYFMRNSGIVDIGWAVGYILTVWAYALLGNGYWLRNGLVALIVTLWAGRLTIYLYQRYISNDEDPRYQEIRRSWGEKNSDFKFFLMFSFQGLLVIVLSVPFMIVCRNTSTEWSWWEFWGVIIWLVGVAGEAFSDKQLKQFKEDPISRGKVCAEGLWRYSRHPNYFFEWLIWVGFAVFAFPSPGGSLAFISPVVMFFLLTRVSGIPLTEQHALETKGDAYREYQRTTSAFIPWFPTK